jgi:hypothetical protein
MASRRERYLKRHTALKNERASHDPHWRELSDYILPRRSRFYDQERNRGEKKHQKIINGTATKAVQTLGAGMLAGITSPSHPWFRLSTHDSELADFGPVSSWLHYCELALYDVFSKSNTYKALFESYQDLAVPGTAPVIIDEDDEDVLRLYVQPTGSYALANSERLVVDTLYREMSMTVVQMVSKFGRNNCSAHVRSEYDKGNYDTWRKVVRVIEPNLDRDPSQANHRGMAFRSCWMEDGKSDREFLREGGYMDCPIAAPRWDATGEDVYGNSPGMAALGDVKALQIYEEARAEGVEKLVDPPTKGPSNMRRDRISLMPGDHVAVDQVSGGTEFGPALVINPSGIVATTESIRDIEQRVNAQFYVDLWAMMMDADRSGITATEVAERHEEKLLLLGPVVLRIQDELLKRLIDRAFGILLRKGRLPPPPRELANQELKVDYTGPLAQAQKLVEAGPVDRLVGFTGNLARIKPDVLDKLNEDATFDEYSRVLGVKSTLMNTAERVQAIRQQRAQQQAAAAQGAAMAQAAQGANQLAGADMSDDNALTRLVGNTLGGVAAAGGSRQ